MASPSGPAGPPGPPRHFVGLLREKCSVEEAMCRQRQRLLDPLEMRKGSDLRCPEAMFSYVSILIMKSHE